MNNAIAAQRTAQRATIVNIGNITRRWKELGGINKVKRDGGLEEEGCLIWRRLSYSLAITLSFIPTPSPFPSLYLPYTV